MRTINALHQAVYAPIDDLTTFRAMPTGSVEQIDPFLFLNHHGPQKYGPGNSGLPFGPHPHRGFETLTYILQGDIMHKDSAHGESIIRAGGIQWMTAGRGLIHSEVSSEEFKRAGGMEEVIQIWMNLPAKDKMTAPGYTGLQKEEIPAISLDNGQVVLNLVSGRWHEVSGPVQSLTGLFMASVFFKEGGTLPLSVAPGRNILFYVVRGELRVNDTPVREHFLVEFGNEGEAITVEAMKEAVLILGHGEPLREPVVAHGPFVMNSAEEIQQAMEDYHAGKFGSWK